MKLNHLTPFALAFVVSSSQGRQNHHKKPMFDQNVVGGESASSGQFPYSAWSEAAGCGASLIWNDIALTAAHCWGLFAGFPLYIGTTTRQEVDNFSEAVTVLEEIRHPEFDDFLLPHDVMILKLENEVTNPGLSLVGLAGHSTRVSPNELLTVMGYGFDFFMEPTEKLKFANVPFVDDAICVDLYSDHPFLYVEPDQMICAGDIVNGGVDACFGDSGGPLVKDDEDMQVGIVSFGEGCGLASYPGVYSRVSAEIEWIKEQVCTYASNPPDWACEGGTSPVPATRRSAAPTVTPVPTAEVTPRPTAVPTQSPTDLAIPVGFHKVQVTVAHDFYPYETSWRLESGNGDVLLSQAVGEVFDPEAIVSKSIAVQTGSYKFILEDDLSDGIFSPGYAEIKVEEKVVLFLEGTEFSDIFTFDFFAGPVETYNLVVQFDNMPSETYVQLKNLDTRTDLYTLQPFDIAEGFFVSEELQLFSSDKLALVIIDSGKNGMNGGYVALASCEEESEKEPLIFVAGDSFEDGTVVTFTVEDRESSRKLGVATKKGLTRNDYLKDFRDHQGSGEPPVNNICRGETIGTHAPKIGA